MAQIHAQWESNEDAWIPPQHQSLLFQSTGWSIKGPLDDDFTRTSIDPIWTVHNPPQRGLFGGITKWGERWFGVLSIGIDDYTQFDSVNRNACHLTQPVPAGNFTTEATAWRGFEGVVSGPGGIGLIPPQEAPYEGGLVLSFSGDTFLLLGVRKSRDLDLPPAVFLRKIAPGLDDTIAEIPVQGTEIRLELKKSGNQYTARYAVDQGKMRQLGQSTITAQVETVGLTAFAYAGVGDLGRMAFSDFRVQTGHIPASYPQIEFRTRDALQPVRWDLGSLTEKKDGTGQIVYQYLTDQTFPNYNGQWQNASQIRQLGTVQSQRLGLKAKLAGGGTATIYLKKISISGTLNTGILPPEQPDPPSAVSYPGEVFLSWGRIHGNPHLRGVEIHRRRQGEASFCASP
jgi:hypothetical protein